MSNTIKLNKSLKRSADTIKVSTLHTRADVSKSSINLERRTVEVVFGTDTPVQMYDWDLGRYMEVLSFDPAHVRLDRANAGSPVLDMHDRYEQIGVIENARIENGKGIATLRFSKNKDAEEVWQDVVDGIKTKVSVGYNVYEYQELTLPGEEVRTLKAIDWEPSEISMVSKPADINSGVRSETTIPKNVKISQLNRSNTMPTEEEIQAQQAAEPAKPANPAEPAKTEAPATAPASEDATRAAATAANNRALAIMQTGRLAGLTQTEIEEIVASNVSADKAREQIVAKFAAKDPNAGSTNIRTGADEVDKRREAMVSGIILRAVPSAVREKIVTDSQAAAGREYRSMSLVDIARECLENAGIKTRGMDKMELVRLAITSSTSDFPVLLSGLNSQVLLASYNAVPDTWRNFCSVGSVSDFRDFRRLRMGTIGNLDKVTENAEYKTKKLSDADYEKVSVDTKGNLINISRKMIINDDLTGITNYLRQLGRAAARSIESDVYAQFALNGGNGPTMVDTLPLFHASHGNIAGTAAVPSVASFDAIRTQMKGFKDKDNNDFLDIMPAIWLGPTALKGTADVVNKSQYDTDVSNKFQVPNKSQGLFNQLVDTPRLTGTAWYAFADPSTEPVFEVSFLDGNETPYLEEQQGFEQDGIVWKIRHDWGVSPVGFRGVIKNAGV